MTKHPAITALLALLLSFAAVGCGDDEPEEPSSSQAIEDAKAAVASVEAAFANPTGEVSADTVADVFAAMDGQELADGALAFVPGAPSAGTQDAHYGSCYSGGASQGTIDLACASSGEVTGTMTWSVATEGNTMYMAFAYNDICSAGTCIDGDGAAKYSNYDDPTSVEIVMVMHFTVTDATGSTHVLDMAYEMSIDAGDLTLKYLVYIDGESFVIQVDATENSVSWTVTGSNGTWTCTATLTESGYVGSCSGDSSFDF